MIQRFRIYMRSRSLRRGVNIHAAMKAWRSPFPIEIVKVNKPYILHAGWSPDYNIDRKNIYFNLSTETPSAFKKEEAKTIVHFPSKKECYTFLDRELDVSLNSHKRSLIDHAHYVYAHECSHKFLSIKHKPYSGHCLAFAIVNCVLLMRLGLDTNEIFRFYNFQDEWEACYSFRKYGGESTLQALKLLVTEAATEICNNYVDVTGCCEKAVEYDIQACSQGLIIKWSKRSRKKIIRERLGRWGGRILLLILCLFWIQLQ